MIAAVAAGQLAWLAWFLAVRLPNAGKDLARWKLALIALPGISFGPSTIGGGLAKLLRWEFLPQRVPLLLAAAWIGAAGVALGLLALRGLGLRRAFAWCERPALAFGLGVAGLGALTLVFGRLGWLSPWSVRIGLGVPIVLEAGLWLLSRWGLAGREPSGLLDPPPALGWSPPAAVAFVAVAALFLVPSFLGAMLPTIDFDALEYHLQGPKEYFQDGRIAFLPHNVYTSMPFGVEMLHLLGMHLLDDGWAGALVGQVLIWAHAPAAAVLIAGTARRWASPRAAWVAAMAYLATPWIYRMAVLPYVEGPLCFYHAALVGTAAVMRPGEDATARRLGGVLGWLAGGAFACKYPALISAVIPFGGFAIVEAIRRRSPAVVLNFGLGLALIAGPWLVKNLVDHGNPVYPLAAKVFGGHPWSDAREAQWSAAHGPKAIAAGDLGAAIVDVAGRSDWQSGLYVSFAPLAFARPGSRRQARVLGGYVAYIFITWWMFTHRLDRFWLPLVPGLAVLAGLGADWTRSRPWSAIMGGLVGFGIFLGLAHSWTDLTALNDWTADLAALRTGVPRMLNPPLAAFDDRLPDDAKPLLVGQAAVFHVRHPFAFNTVFDDEILEAIAEGRTPAAVAEELQRRGITHIYVDWHEIDRHRRPGGYGFSEFVRPELFAGLVEAGVLDPPVAYGAEQVAYKVAAARSPRTEE